VISLSALLAPLVVQSTAMGFDELYFHRKRGLGLWERVGHPLDTLTVLACMAWLALAAPSPGHLTVYVGLAAFSCLFITKDEVVHARVCAPGEHWVHALLFIVHPLCLASLALLWPSLHPPVVGPLGLPAIPGAARIFAAQCAVTSSFCLYQAAYWAFHGVAPRGPANNAVYDALDERWYDAKDDPVALLRAESACRKPWIEAEIKSRVSRGTVRVLDVGCGGGFLSNALARTGHQVTGVDASEASLAVATRHDSTRTVRYVLADARRLPFPDASFDVVCAMDFLEHIDEPAAAIAEAARVLVPGGVFFFHTFNRNWLAWLVIIKGVEWFVRNVPRDLHVLRLFLKPDEVRAMCDASDLTVSEVRGFEPTIWSWAFFRMLGTGRVPDDFTFHFTRSTRIAYTGLATKGGERNP
jgi:2-polyprenyl-6-hydroxyphenyl methylase/3-demethylubiquinone-9 3-methyltransferase